MPGDVMAIDGGIDAGRGIALAATPGAGLTPWTAMFLDSAASVLDSARIRVIGGLFSPSGTRTDGYSQLPVEMESRASLPPV